MHPGFRAFLISATFLIAVSGLAWGGLIPSLIAWVYWGASCIALFQYAVDKSSATKGRRRIPEVTMHQVSLFGGWPGALVGQQALRHKTQKQPFRRIFWLTVMLNVGVLAYFASPYGRWLMQTLDG